MNLDIFILHHSRKGPAGSEGIFSYLGSGISQAGQELRLSHIGTTNHNYLTSPFPFDFNSITFPAPSSFTLNLEIFRFRSGGRLAGISYAVSLRLSFPQYFIYSRPAVGAFTFHSLALVLHSHLLRIGHCFLGLALYAVTFYWSAPTTFTHFLHLLSQSNYTVNSISMQIFFEILIFV